jgi:hypothetical protein
MVKQRAMCSMGQQIMAELSGAAAFGTMKNNANISS